MDKARFAFATFSLLAQAAGASTDPTSGYIGLILQGGGFLFSVVIVLVLLPKSARDAREEREKQSQMWQGILTAVQANADARNTALASVISQQTNDLKNSFDKSAERVERAVVNVCRGKPS